jgi:hypothetical protein
MTFLEARLSEAHSLRNYYATLSHTLLNHSGAVKDFDVEVLTTRLRAPHALDALGAALRWSRAEEAASEEFLSWAPREDHKFGIWTPEGHYLLPTRDKARDLKFKFDPKKPLTDKEVNDHLSRGPGSGPTILYAKKILAKSVEIRKALEDAYETAATLRIVAKAGEVATSSASRQGGIDPTERRAGRVAAVTSSSPNKPRR